MGWGRLWVEKAGEALRVRPLLGAGVVLYLVYRLPPAWGAVVVGLLAGGSWIHPVFRFLVLLGLGGWLLRPPASEESRVWTGVFRVEEARVVAWRAPGSSRWYPLRVTLFREYTPPGYRRVAVGRLEVSGTRGRLRGTWLPEEPAPGWRARIRRAVYHRLTQLYPPSTRGLVVALLLGNRVDLSQEDRERLRRAGLFHILALSGLHVGFLLGVLWILGVMGGVPLQVRYGILLVGLGGYLWLVGVRPSILRATLMAVLWIAGRAGSRPLLLGQVWGGALFASVMGFPEWIRDAGFHLSFLATAGIFLILSEGPRLPRWLQGVAVSLGASLATWPYLAYRMGSVNLLAPVWNALALPVVGLAFAEGMLSLVGGTPFAWVAHHLLRGVVGTAGELPGSLDVRLTVLEMMGAYGILGAVWVGLRRAGGKGSRAFGR